MRIAISGSHGLIGSRLFRQLSADDHQVSRLIRSKAGTYDEAIAGILCDPIGGTAALDRLDGTDVIIHLAGTPLVSRAWTPGYKRAIRNSRVDPTDFLVNTLGRLRHRPSLFISASAVGYYGTGDAPCTEETGRGQDFLSDVCAAWEAASRRAESLGIRVVNVRFGPVLDISGGLLARMLPIFRWGLGGKIGSGGQWISWVGIDEIVSVVRFLLKRPDLSGPFNVVSPQPVTNAQFAAALAGVLKRPCAATIPLWLVRLVLGEMGDTMLVKGTRALPARLQAAGYAFQDPALSPLLKRLLNS